MYMYFTCTCTKLLSGFLYATGCGLPNITCTCILHVHVLNYTAVFSMLP